ncbi:MAG: hypothetical protein JNL01_09675 [Bdellovibrionales bacterium]|nr:hypothetical protein [Bdellovibrionales bacterium]
MPADTAFNLDRCLATLPGPWGGGPCLSGFVGRSITMAAAGWIFGIVFYRFMRTRVLFPVSTMTVLLALLGGAMITAPIFVELVPIVIFEFAGPAYLYESEKLTFAFMVAAQCIAVLIGGRKGGLTSLPKPSIHSNQKPGSNSGSRPSGK